MAIMYSILDIRNEKLEVVWEVFPEGPNLKGFSALTADPISLGRPHDFQGSFSLGGTLHEGRDFRALNTILRCCGYQVQRYT